MLPTLVRRFQQKAVDGLTQAIGNTPLVRALVLAGPAFVF